MSRNACGMRQRDGNVRLVALEMGTSVRMIFSHYREVVSKPDASRFERIRPRKIWRR